jgi:hypothetical protein
MSVRMSRQSWSGGAGHVVLAGLALDRALDAAAGEGAVLDRADEGEGAAKEHAADLGVAVVGGEGDEGAVGADVEDGELLEVLVVGGEQGLVHGRGGEAHVVAGP